MLKTSVQFVNIDGSETLRKYLRERVSPLQKRFNSSKRSAHLELRLIQKSRQPDGTLKRAEAEVFLHVPGQETRLVKKSGTDLKQISKAALEAIETMVRREAEKHESARRTAGRTKRSVRSIKRSAQQV